MWKQNGLQEIYETKRRNRMHLPVTNRLASVEADVFKRGIELASDSIRNLLAGKTLTADSFNFFSPEHNQHFEAKDIRLKIEKEQDNPDKLRLTLNSQDITEWFKQKHQDLQKTVRIKPAQPIKTDESRGFRV